MPDAGLPTLPAQAELVGLLRALPDPVLLIEQAGPEGRAGRGWLNPAARERLASRQEGEPAERAGDLSNSPFSDLLSDWQALFPAETARLLSAAAAQVGAGGPPVRQSVRLEGSQAPALATLTPGGPGWALLHLRDSRHPLEVAEELMDGLGLGMLVQDQDGRVLQANAAGQLLLGLDLAQMSGAAPADARWHTVSPDGAPLPSAALPTAAALHSGEVQRDVPVGVVIPGAGGQPPQTRWLNVTAVPRGVPGAAHTQGVTTVFADVTRERELREQLGRSEERYRSLVEATSQIVWITTPAGELLGPQPGWTAFTGQTPEEFSGAGWLEALHPEDRAPTLAAWQHAVASGQPYQAEYRLRRADGVYLPVQARGVAVRGPDGQVREWMGVNQDLSAVRAAQEHLRALNAELEERVQSRTRELADLTRFSTLLLGAAGEGIFGLDAAGRTTFANRAAARLLGYGVERLIGSDQHALIHHHHADGQPHALADCPVHQTLRDGQPRRREADVFWHAQGHPVPVSYVVTPTQDAAGAVTGAVVMFQDITERQRAQSALEAAVANLERSNKDLEQFAYIASHDLQEPLRTVGSYAELLSRRYRGQLDPRADQYLAFMGDAVERMRSLIQDLLGFARVGRVGAPPQPVPLAGVLRQAEQNVQSALGETGGELSWEADQTVPGHAGLLVQLLTNLISNGLKFHREGVPPRVRVTAHTEGSQVHLRVADNGIGIAPEYHERVFAIFQRLNSRETYPGNGMGLAICRKIAESHGGSLTLSSEPGQGSTFHLYLPLERAPA